METSNRVETKKGDTLVGRVLNAIEKKDETALTVTLKEMNQILTGQEQAHFQNEEILTSEVGEIMKAIKSNDTEVVYLGDGGLSRLIVGMYLNKPDIDISSVSTETVKTKWKGLQEEYDKAVL